MVAPSCSATDFVRLLRARAEAQADRLAFTMAGEADSETAFSYAELDASARRVAAELMARALTGERVLLLLHPGEDYLHALLGCWYAGAVAVPVYAPRQNASAARIHLIARDCQAAALVSTRKLLDSLEGAAVFSSLQQIAIDAVAADAGQHWHMPQLGPDTLAVLQYTSGSTGDPKGVCLRHRQLIENSRIISSVMQTGPDSVCVIWVPPYHDMGLIGGVLQPLYGGFPVHLMQPAAFLQRPLRWLESISRHRGSISAAPNFAFDLCVRRARPEQIERLDLSSWRVAANGAEPIRAETLKRFAATFAPAGFDARAFFPCYGMAESTLLVAGGPAFGGAVARDFDREALLCGQLMPGEGVSLVSSGRAADGVSLAIVHPDTGQPCASGEVGEVWISGDTVADGYWQRAQATADSFHARLPGSDAAWLRSGDLGAVCEGELFVTGRIKDVIVIHGHNHYPHDIEATVLAAHPALRPEGAAAFALQAEEGESLGLVIELERGHHGDDLDAIRIAVVEALSREHQLHVGQLAFVRANSLPKTSSGKLQRRATRQRLLSGGFERLDQPEIPA